jgi:large subunit ribosomal protein L10
MPRPEKVQAVAEIKDRIEGAQAVFVTEFRGMTVKQLSQLRRSLRETGADYKVFKMTLARRAADELGIEGIAEHLVGPTALTFAGTDAVATAKALRDAGRDNDKLVVKAGIIAGGSVIPPEQVSKLADIEPREVLLSKIAGAAKAPMVQMAGLLVSFTRNAATMFSQLLEKMESDAPVETTPVEEAPAPEEPAVEESAGEAAAEEAPAEEEPAAEAPAAETPVADEAPVVEEAETPAGTETASPEEPASDDDEPAASAEEE